MDAALAANADEIFAMAKAIAAEREAKFQVIFLVYPHECRTKSFDFDITLLKTEYITMMPYCLDEEVMANMRFKTDRHLNAVGNEWAARSLLDIIESNILKRELYDVAGASTEKFGEKGSSVFLSFLSCG